MRNDRCEMESLIDRKLGIGEVNLHCEIKNKLKGLREENWE